MLFAPVVEIVPLPSSRLSDGDQRETLLILDFLAHIIPKYAVAEVDVPDDRVAAGPPIQGKCACWFNGDKDFEKSKYCVRVFFCCGLNNRSRYGRMRKVTLCMSHKKHREMFGNPDKLRVRFELESFRHAVVSFWEEDDFILIDGSLDGFGVVGFSISLGGVRGAFHVQCFVGLEMWKLILLP